MRRGPVFVCEFTFIFPKRLEFEKIMIRKKRRIASS